MNDKQRQKLRANIAFRIPLHIHGNMSVIEAYEKILATFTSH